MSENKLQFWEVKAKKYDTKVGSDKIFSTPELLLEACLEYHEWNAANPLIAYEVPKVPKKNVDPNDPWGHLDKVPKMRAMSLHGLTSFLGCTLNYFKDFKLQHAMKQDPISKKFIAVIGAVEQLIYRQKFEGSAGGFLNANIIARDLGLTDKQEVKSEVVVNQIDYSKLSDQALAEIERAANPHSNEPNPCDDLI